MCLDIDVRPFRDRFTPSDELRLVLVGQIPDEIEDALQHSIHLGSWNNTAETAPNVTLLGRPVGSEEKSRHSTRHETTAYSLYGAVGAGVMEKEEAGHTHSKKTRIFSKECKEARWRGKRVRSWCFLLCALFGVLKSP